MNQSEFDALMAENACSGTAMAAVRQLRGLLWTPDEGGYCLKFARMAVEIGNGLPDGATYSMAPGIHTGRYAGDVGDAFWRMGWAVDGEPKAGDLVFQRGLKSEMGGCGALISAPFGHVGVVIMHQGVPWVAENTLAVNRGMYIANRSDVAKNNRMTPLDQWGAHVVIRIPDEKLNRSNKPAKAATTKKMTVMVDGVDVTGKRVVLPSGLVVNAETPDKVQIRTTEPQK